MLTKAQQNALEHVNRNHNPYTYDSETGLHPVLCSLVESGHVIFRRHSTPRGDAFYWQLTDHGWDAIKNVPGASTG